MALEFPQLMKTIKKAESLIKGGSEILPEEEVSHRDLVKITSQLSSTTKIIQNNSQLFQELSIGNVEIQNLLNEVSDSEREAITQKLLSREEITKEEANKLITSLESITSILSDVSVSMEVNVGDLIGNFKGMVFDNRIDVNNRRKIVGDIKEFISKQGIQSDAIEDLSKINTESLNFTKEENEKLNKILNKITADATNVKISATLDELNKSFDSSLLTQKELTDVLEKQGGSEESLKERFLKRPGLISQGKEISSGLISLALSSVGLGGLDQAFGLSDVLSGGVGKVIGKGLGGLGGILGRAGGVVTGAGGEALGGLGGSVLTTASRGAGLFGRVAGGAGGILSKGAGFLGKAALPLLAAKGLFDFTKGFGKASEIAGLEPGKEVGLGTKIQAGGASAISGLTLGLVDPKTVFGGIEKAKEFGTDLFKSSMETVQGGLSTATDFFKNTDFGVEKIIDKAVGLGKKLIEFSPIGLIGKEVSSLFDFFGKDKKSTAEKVRGAIAPRAEPIDTALIGRVSPIPTILSTRTGGEITETFKGGFDRTPAMITGPTTPPRAPVMINQPIIQEKRVSDNKLAIDDVNLAFMNSFL